MMNQPSMRVMSKEYMLAHAGECVAISDDGLSFEAVECGGGGGGVTNITYAALVTAIGASGLTAGQQYKITDYATVHYIVDASGTQYFGSIITGVNEPLIVTASSSNTLEPVAYSALHPEDIMDYDWNPANWLDDLSFNNAGVIITGFKGVIEFRHDTRLDNYAGYDFRNCEFRRWKTNCTIWDDSTPFSKGAYVNSSGFIYMALQDSTNEVPAGNLNFWVQLLNLALTEYYCNNPTSTNGITAGTDFIDVKTFAEGSGTATYDRCCRSNHFEPFKDDSYDYDISATILMNNVFWLQNKDYYTVFSNSFGSECYSNTFAGGCRYNNVAANCSSNIIGDDFYSNTIGSSFSANTIGNNFYNAVGNFFHNNIMGNGCNGSTAGNYFHSNVLGDNFHLNEIGNYFNSNTILYSFNYNTVGNLFNSNTVGVNFRNNTIGNNISGCIMGDGFALNQVQNASVVGVDFTAATHVYAAYNKTIFTRVDGTAKLSYCDNSDVIQVVNANA